jgi:hypothetical protein
MSLRAEPHYLPESSGFYRSAGSGISDNYMRNHEHAMYVLGKLEAQGVGPRLLESSRNLRRSKLGIHLLLRGEEGWRSHVRAALGIRPLGARELFFGFLSMCPRGMSEKLYRFAHEGVTGSKWTKTAS